MSISKPFTKFKSDIVDNIPGLIALSINDMDSGISYLSYSSDPNFDPDLASSFNLEVAKAKMQAIKSLGINQDIIDILITLEKQIHIIDISTTNNFIIYLAVDSGKGNLGMTRALLAKYKKELMSGI